MKIVHAASELFPFVKTGGLADVVGAVGKSLAKAGHEVVLFLPGYRMALASPAAADAEPFLSVNIEMGDSFVTGTVHRLKWEKNLTVYFVVRDEFFDRSYLYGLPQRDYDDNAERFIFFSKSIIEVLHQLHFVADVVHAHDWQTALVPLFLRDAERKRSVSLGGKTVFTIHNLAYQGVFPHGSFALTNLPPELLSIDGLEFFGQVNFMKGGLLFSDRITTVSPTYAREIMTHEFGCGLEGVLSMRKDDVASILNGIDTEVWNPKTDTRIPATYSVDEMKGKDTCRSALLDQLKLRNSRKAPVFGMVSRFTSQKGFDLLIESMEFFNNNGCRLIILGGGDPGYEKRLTAFAESHPENIAVRLGMNEDLGHLIIAGSDYFLMPSLFEPCGLTQMYSQHYGTIPVTSRVGGLVDTVRDIDEDSDSGTGITFAPRKPAFQKGLARALTLYENKSLLRAIRRNGMKQDFSWANAARQYENLYREMV